MARIAPMQALDLSLPTLTGSLIPQLQEVEDKFDVQVNGFVIEIGLNFYAAFLGVLYTFLGHVQCPINLYMPPLPETFSIPPSELCYGCQIIGGGPSTSACSMLSWCSAANGS
jgi:hypothetical protein